MIESILDFFFGKTFLTKEEIQEKINTLLENDYEISYLHKKAKVPVKIKECGDGIRALYNIKKKEIWISPYGFDENSLREALLHESIHAYDHLYRKINIQTINGLAQTEVHAMKQCECRKAWFTKSCTRNKAIEAVQLSVGSEVKAREAVDNVMDSAYYEELWPHPFD